MDELQQIFGSIQLGEIEDISAIDDLLSNEKIFGVNLDEAGLSEKIIKFFKELSDGPGAVRSTLKKYLS